MEKPNRPFYPTPRDTQIVTTVYTHRALTSDQVSVLFWGSAKAHTRSRHRLRLLAEHGFLERGEQAVTLSEGRRPLVYFLDRAGAALVAQELGVDPAALDWKPAHNRLSWPFLDHLLATNDIRVRVEHAAPRCGFDLVEWQDDFSLAKTIRRDHLPIGPDGYLALVSAGDMSLHRAFVEADRGTVPLTRWSAKVRSYLAYFASPQYRDRYQATKPCRVLTVTTSETRLTHMKQIAEEAGGAPWFWFTTFDALASLEAILLSPVWQMAGSSNPVCFPYPPSLFPVTPAGPPDQTIPSQLEQAV